MTKIPEAERPPFEEIQNKLYDRVSHSLRQLFVCDIQNDCGCDVETYDCDLETNVWFLESNSSVKRLEIGNRMSCPILPEISNNSIELLLQKACEGVNNYCTTDTIPAAVLANPKCDTDKLVHILDKITRRGLSINRSGIIYGAALLDFVPENHFYILPDPEFFGVIAVNLGGYGAFCYSKCIYRYGD